MSRLETPVPHLPSSSNWNVVRSKSVPSGVSGSHTVAKLNSSAATDTSILNQDGPALPNTRKVRIGIEPADSPVVKH